MMIEPAGEGAAPIVSRIIEEENITRTKEAVAPRIEITWDPVTNDGSVFFFVQDLVIENGNVVGLLPHTRLKDADLGMRVPLSRITERVFTVQTPEGEMVVNGALIGAFIRAAFDELFNEAYSAQVAAETPIEAPVVEEPAPEPEVTDAP